MGRRVKFDNGGEQIGKIPRPKKSFIDGKARTRIAQQKPLSSEFIDLGNNNPRVFSFPHIEGAALAHQLRLLSKPFEIKQNADNTEIAEHSLANTKMTEFAEAFLTAAPNRFLRALLKVAGLDSNFPRLNGERAKLLKTRFEALKQSFLPNKNNPIKLSDIQKRILKRFEAERSHRRSPDKSEVVSNGLSDKTLALVKNTWQKADSEFALAA